jgi:tungstate transport system substrate-binding protein
MKTTALMRSLLVTVAILLTCPGATQFAQAAQPLRLATTTSTENSGLLTYLIPAFEKQSGLAVHVIAVGTGKALRIARAGDGPGSDPAGIAESSSVVESLRRIAASGSRFVSRGDDSGTNKKELVLWQMAGVKPVRGWYVESGLGMGKVLQMASELDAYTLTDRGTWLAYRGHLELTLLLQGDPPLFNPYGIIAVNPERHPHVNYAGATALIDWLASADGQKMIARYTVDGQVLFHPLLLPRD